MKNICLVNWDFSFVGGISNVVSSLSEEFSKRYNTHVLSINDENNKLGANLSEKVKYHVINKGTNRVRNACVKSFFPILKYLKKNKIDIVFGVGHYTGPVLLPVSKFSKAKFVFCDHGAIANQLDDFTAVSFRKSAAKHFDKIITLTNRNRDDYIKMFNCQEDKVICIPNWVDSKVIKCASAQYDIASKKIITAGRFTPEKGFDMLVDVAEMVFAKYPDWSWDLYGDGKLFEQIKAKVMQKNLQDNLILKGMATDLCKRYKQYAMYVLPSYREGLSLVLLESKVNRLPLVSFNCVAGPSEIITDGEDGFLIGCYDKKMMAKKICDLIESDRLRQKFSDNWSLNLEKFQKEKILDKWLNLIESFN